MSRKSSRKNSVVCRLWRSIAAIVVPGVGREFNASQFKGNRSFVKFLGVTCSGLRWSTAQAKVRTIVWHDCSRVHTRLKAALSARRTIKDCSFVLWVSDEHDRPVLKCRDYAARSISRNVAIPNHTKLPTKIPLSVHEEFQHLGFTERSSLIMD